MDQPLVWYEGTGTTDRRFLSSDERGSVISVTDSSGTMLGINKYDEYGMPQAGNSARSATPARSGCRAWASGITRRASMSRSSGGSCRPTRSDAGGINVYAYVGNDPVNWVDPLGLEGECVGGEEDASGCDIVVTGPPPTPRTFCQQNQWLCDGMFGNFDFCGMVRSTPAASLRVTEVAGVATSNLKLAKHCHSQAFYRIQRCKIRSAEQLPKRLRLQTMGGASMFPAMDPRLLSTFSVLVVTECT